MKFQPLDYTFFIIIAMMALYGAYRFWNNFLRINEKTTDDLVERYVILEKHASRR